MVVAGVALLRIDVDAVGEVAEEEVVSDVLRTDLVLRIDAGADRREATSNVVEPVAVDEVAVELGAARAAGRVDAARAAFRRGEESDRRMADVVHDAVDDLGALGLQPDAAGFVRHRRRACDGAVAPCGIRGRHLEPDDVHERARYRENTGRLQGNLGSARMRRRRRSVPSTHAVVCAVASTGHEHMLSIDRDDTRERPVMRDRARRRDADRGGRRVGIEHRGLEAVDRRTGTGRRAPGES